VNVYAVAAVAASRRPAFLPTSAMPGAISPKMSRGMMKLSRLENIPLMVAKILDNHSGNIIPPTTPRIIAIIICASSGIFFVFIVSFVYLFYGAKIIFFLLIFVYLHYICIG
jgi:hypothetical protein